MTFRISVSGAAAEAVRVASGLAALDPTLWGPEAEEESSKRLGWMESATVSRPLVKDILALRETLTAAGVTHFVLAGMGGSSLAPEVITQTAGVELTVIDATAPGQVLAALNDRLEASAPLWRPTAHAAYTSAPSVMQASSPQSASSSSPTRAPRSRRPRRKPATGSSTQTPRSADATPH